MTHPTNQNPTRIHRADLTGPSAQDVQIKRMQSQIDDLLRENHELREKMRKDESIYEQRINELLGDEHSRQALGDFNGWYCKQCQAGVNPSEVTFHETHEACGRYITDDRPPTPAALQEWKPIDTAPLDRPILVREDDDIYKAHWDKELECWSAMCVQPVVYKPEPTEWTEIPGSTPVRQS